MPFPRRIHLLNPYGSRTLPRPQRLSIPDCTPAKSRLGGSAQRSSRRLVRKWCLAAKVRTWDGENHGLPILSYGYGLSQGKNGKTNGKTRIFWLIGMVFKTIFLSYDNLISDDSRPMTSEHVRTISAKRQNRFFGSKTAIANALQVRLATSKNMRSTEMEMGHGKPRRMVDENEEHAFWHQKKPDTSAKIQTALQSATWTFFEASLN